MTTPDTRREPRPQVVVCADPIQEAARRAVSALAPLETPRLAIPGGSAAGVVRHIRSGLGARWRHVRLTWTDERCVPFADEDSNRGAAHRAGWLDRDDPPGLELALFREDRAEHDLERRALMAGVDFRLRFGATLDVVVLGMGGDGHIASLFPGRQDNAANSGEYVAFVGDSPKPPPNRMTLTPKALRTASLTLLVAFGEAKRPALRRLRDGDPSLPATGLPGLTIITDAALS